MANVDPRVFAEALDLKVVFAPERSMLITETDVNRPGLQLAGFFDYFPSERLQVFGRSETTYYSTLEEKRGREMLKRIISAKPPGVVVCRGLPISRELEVMCGENSVPLFVSDISTSSFVTRAMQYFTALLAPMETRHGVLVEVFGMGMLLTGDSGIGKSETALELIKNGHRLVADDAVEIKRLAGDMLVGAAPEVIQFMMEIRGLGLIDVRSMFGVGAVLPEKSIDAVVEMKHFDDATTMDLDRASIVRRYEEILGVKVPLMLIPVAPGRNLSMLVEIASRQMRLESMGINATEVLDRRLEEVKRQKTLRK